MLFLSSETNSVLKSLSHFAWFFATVTVVVESADLYGLATGNHEARVAAVVVRYVSSALGLYTVGKVCWEPPRLDDELGDCDSKDLRRCNSGTALLYILASALLPLTGNGIFFAEHINWVYIIVASVSFSFFSFITAALPTRLLAHRATWLVSQLDYRKLFIRHISHEMRTPLNTLCVGLDLLDELLERRGVSVVEVHDLLGDMKESCSVAVSALSGILDYERLGSNLMVIHSKHVYPLPFLQKSLRPFFTLASAKGVQLIFGPDQYASIDNGTWKLHIDPFKMSQVVSNFVSNAIKFSPEGSTVVVTASVIVISSETFLRVDIIDHGPGMSPAHQALLFNQIVQFNANELQGGGGSGIGLWVSKKIVDLHRGKVRVHSELGVGSTFTVELPLKRAADVVESEREENHSRIRIRPAAHRQRDASGSRVVPIADVPTADDSARRGITVDAPRTAYQGRALIVDDSSLNRKMMMRLMQSKGYDCMTANDGQQAIDMFEESRRNGEDFGHILMDSQMPHMNGGESITRLRAIGCDAVIIGVTGDALPEEVAAFMACGADDVLVKPVNIRQLESSLHVRQENRRASMRQAPSSRSNSIEV